jgi:hypothetical protein
MNRAVQIYFNEQHHWVISTARVVGNIDTDVYVCDSLPAGSVGSVFGGMQLIDLYRVLARQRWKNRSNKKYVQQQSRLMGNCGPHAVVVAAALSHGIDSSCVSFSEHSLRKHSHGCFLSGADTCFLQTTRNVAKIS